MMKVYQLDWDKADRARSVHYMKDDALAFRAAEWLREGQYKLVAEIVGDDDEEYAYSMTNTCTHPWWENAGVTKKFDGHGCRSTSVGDVVELSTGDRKVVARVGFIDAAHI